MNFKWANEVGFLFVKGKIHCCRMFWSMHINRLKKRLDKFMDDRPGRGTKHNLMQPLAQKLLNKNRDDIWGLGPSLLPFFCVLFPVHSPDALLKPDKPLVWSRTATPTVQYSRNIIVTHALFITQIVWSCFICQHERTVHPELQYLHSKLAAQFISCWV